MAKRMDIEDFFEEIDPDLLKYASAFRKCGFSSSVTMKYWREQDFQNLEVEVPEGHRRLILNMVTKIRTLELKSAENRSSFMPLTGIPGLKFRPESLPNGCRNSNVWLPSLSRLRPIRTCFSPTCPRLDENDGISNKITISYLYPLNRFRLIFLLRDSENDLLFNRRYD